MRQPKTTTIILEKESIFLCYRNIKRCLYVIYKKVHFLIKRAMLWETYPEIRSIKATTLYVQIRICKKLKMIFSVLLFCSALHSGASCFIHLQYPRQLHRAAMPAAVPDCWRQAGGPNRPALCKEIQCPVCFIAGFRFCSEHLSGI